jgi:hypothetical protein
MLFASDGLFGMVKDNDRLRDILVENSDPDEAARALIAAANAAGGEDNISAVIVDVLGEATQGAVEAEEEADPSTVIVERDGVLPATEVGRRRIPRRTLVVAGAIVLLAVMGVVFVLRPSTRTYVVSARRGHVVVLSGHPGTSESDPATGKVVRVFRNDELHEFPTAVQRSLRTGIPVDSLREASEVVAQLPRVLGPEETPTPTPKTTPTASTSPEPLPTETEAS